ncbi:MAG: AMP-binding protein [Phenylobacterium sp.]|uniref:AMP-binding protein n=1 Tax=Phenylobacterium sp. TaxID=1871053 RepID=UPI00273761D9|nr:AMP-binding protein [Phenylobacterium sp.]MDP3746677.1 AMP-binding protein [Phenylobacterium sp.]
MSAAVQGKATMASEIAEAGPIDVDLRLRAAAARHPERPALKDSHRAISWGELDPRINRIGNALIGVGVAPNDRVAILAHNSVAYAELILGTCAPAPASRFGPILSPRTHGVRVTHKFKASNLEQTWTNGRDTRP